MLFQMTICNRSIAFIVPEDQRASLRRSCRVAGVRFLSIHERMRENSDVIVFDQRCQKELYDEANGYDEVLDAHMQDLLNRGGTVVSVGWSPNPSVVREGIAPPTGPTVILPVQVESTPIEPPATFFRRGIKFYGGVGDLFSSKFNAGRAFPLAEQRGGKGTLMVGGSRVKCDVLLQDSVGGRVVGISIPYGDGRLVVLPRPEDDADMARFFERLVDYLMSQRYQSSGASADDAKLLRFSGGKAVLCGQPLKLPHLCYETLLYLARQTGRPKNYKAVMGEGLKKEGAFQSNESFRGYVSIIRQEYELVIKKHKLLKVHANLPSTGLKFLESLGGGRYVLNLDGSLIALPRKTSRRATAPLPTPR